MENRLKARREALGLSQIDVSQRLRAVEPRADVGMVSRYECGVCLPTRPQMEALEKALQAERRELYEPWDLDLLGALDTLGKRRSRSEGKRTMRKCFRMPRSFADTLPADLLETCGYTSWQSWYDAAIKRLLGEYAARKKAASRGANTADGRDKNDTHNIHHSGGKVNGPHAER